MPTPNPDYNPDWEALHDYHDAERTRLRKEMNALNQRDREQYDAGNTNYDTPEHLEHKQALQDEWDNHHEQCKRCLDTYQHETVQDAAEWLFKNFDPSMGSLTTHTIHQMDFEKFTSIEEVHSAWSKACSVSEQIEAEATKSLPTGRPDGLDIFEEMGGNQIVIAVRVFDKRELHPNTFQYVMGDGCEVLLTVDKRENGDYHICFSQDSEMARGGMFLQYKIEALATAMYRHVYTSEMAVKPQHKSLPGVIVSSVKGALSKLANAVSFPVVQKASINPGQFHFYIHHPPEPRQREKFFCMDMEFKDGEFQNPKFHHSEVIPTVVQQAFREQKTASADAVIVEEPYLLTFTSHD